jgi:hypothetical protein
MLAVGSPRGAHADDHVAIGDAHARGRMVGALASYGRGPKLAPGAVPVATAATKEAGPVLVSAAVPVEVSALWGLVLLEVGRGERPEVVKRAVARRVPLRLGEWLTRPAGLDAIEILEPETVPVGASVVDERGRLLGLVARVPTSTRPVLVRERTLRLFASQTLAGDWAREMSHAPSALVVDDRGVALKLAARAEALERHPAVSAGAFEFETDVPDASSAALRALRTGGFAFGPEAAPSLVVVLPPAGLARTAVLKQLDRVLAENESLRLVIHPLAADPGTEAARLNHRAFCTLWHDEATTASAFVRALADGGASFREDCDAGVSAAFVRDEAARLRGAGVDEPLLLVRGVPMPITESAATIRASLEEPNESTQSEAAP